MFPRQIPGVALNFGTPSTFTRRGLLYVVIEHYDVADFHVHQFRAFYRALPSSTAEFHRHLVKESSQAQ